MSSSPVFNSKPVRLQSCLETHFSFTCTTFKSCLSERSQLHNNTEFWTYYYKGCRLGREISVCPDGTINVNPDGCNMHIMQSWGRIPLHELSKGLWKLGEGFQNNIGCKPASAPESVTESEPCFEDRQANVKKALPGSFFTLSSHADEESVMAEFNI